MMKECSPTIVKQPVYNFPTIQILKLIVSKRREGPSIIRQQPIKKEEVRKRCERQEKRRRSLTRPRPWVRVGTALDVESIMQKKNCTQIHKSYNRNDQLVGMIKYNK